MIVRNTKKLIMTMRTERGVEAVDTNMLLEITARKHICNNHRNCDNLNPQVGPRCT